MRKCAFCPKPADSQEHVWSEWIRKMLPSDTLYNFRRAGRDGKITTRQTRVPPEHTIGIVCEKNCNNGWMSKKLEEPMRALTADILLSKKAKIFSPGDCATLAAWAFKTTVLSNYFTEIKPFFTQEDRYAFARKLTIPAGVHVWIAQRYAAGHITGDYKSIYRVQQPLMSIMPHLVDLPISPYRFEYYTCTFSVGYLILQVVATRWTEREVRQFLYPPPIAQHKKLDGHAISIWPNNGFSVNWPPPFPVTNQMMDWFWDRFTVFNIPSWMSGR